MLDLPVWREGTPRQVMNGVVADVENHRDRVEFADTTLPIIVSRFVLDDVDDYYLSISMKSGKYDVLDGVHRLCKQVMNQSPFIFVTVATREQIEATKL